ncbi:MAG: DUF3870 domain-containing protein [Synergistetes bacterium]|nr:DUF3870 domain-containing protein [Synergistota bacterium]
MSTLFIATYAHLPKDITAYELYKVLGLFLEVDEESGIIMDVEVSVASSIGRRILTECMKGKSLISDLDLIKRELYRRYHGEARGAVVAALNAARQRFIDRKKKIEEG